MDIYLLKLAIGGILTGLLFVPVFNGTNFLVVGALFDPNRPRLMVAVVFISIFVSMMAVGVLVFTAINLLQLQPMGSRGAMFVVFAAVGWTLFWVFLQNRFLAALSRRRE